MSKKDVKIFYADEDIKKIQLKPNMYIQKFGKIGTFHLSKECIQNSIDELEDKDTNGSKIYISYDHKSDKLTVEDDGRGIPEDDYPIDIVCTGIQSGSKFFRENGKSSGEFGVGLVVCNALASYFKLATYRNTYVHIIEFENGEKVNDIKRDLKPKEKKHGTITEFIANPKYLGNDSNLPFDMMLDWIETMSYLISANIKIVVDEFDGLNKIKTHKIKTHSFEEIIKKFVSDTKKIIYDPISFSSDSFIEEIIQDTKLNKKDTMKVKQRKVKKDIHLDVVFTHDDKPECEYDSYCNFTRTEEGGVHLDSVEEAICRFFQSKTKANMTENEKKKWDITWADIKWGMKMVINLSTSAQVQFMGNAKNKIQNAELKPILKEMVMDELTKYFDQNSGKLTGICKNIKLNARARIESQKVRAATKVERLDRFSEHELKNYKSCKNRGSKYKELICVEGEKSATGSVTNERDGEFQAIFGFRGVTKNPYKCSFADVMNNAEWKNFVKVLRTGIGKEFNINKLYFDKIILMSDADIDGYYISEGIAAFIALYMPEIITEGHLYKCYPPLYLINEGKNKTRYLNSKSDLTEYFMKKVMAKYQIYLSDSKKPMNKTELFDFLFDTMDSYNKLLDLQTYFSTDKFFIERIANFLVINDIHKTNNLDKYLNSQTFVTSFMNYIQKKYPEVYLEKRSLRGVVCGKAISVRINERNLKKFNDFEDIFKIYGYEIKVSYKNSPEKDRIMTIGEFMEETYPLRAKIASRYKGLGEIKEGLWETSLDPERRVLVRLTMEDCEKSIKKLQELNGNKKSDLLARKEMMENYRINIEDLDN